MRKANRLVLMATQSLSDAVNSGILDVIKETTASKIFLANPNARRKTRHRDHSRLRRSLMHVSCL